MCIYKIIRNQKMNSYHRKKNKTVKKGMGRFDKESNLTF